ncbi:unnamed protein product [Alopecurus aequalis]
MSDRAERRKRRQLERARSPGSFRAAARPPEMAMPVGDAAAEHVVDASQTRQNGRPGRSTNYTEAEDVALLKAWEGVRLDGNDQDGKRYWQRIGDRFYRLMMPDPSTRSLRSLRSRHGAIKQSCSRWSACLEQARSAPPSGCTTVDDDAQERYRQMAASKGKAFVLHHCWKLLEHSEKWKLMYREGPPTKKWKSNSPATDLDTADDEEEDDDDAEKEEDDDGEKEEEKEEDDDGEKEEEKEEDVDAEKEEDDDGEKQEEKEEDDDGGGTSSSMMIAEWLKASNEMTARTLQMKMELAEKKQQHKMAMWQRIKEIEDKKMDFEERRLLLEENKWKQEITAEENKLMMMDPNGMDETARTYWEIRRGEILQSRRWAAGMRGGGSASGGGNDGDGEGGGNNGGDGNGGIA